MRKIVEEGEANEIHDEADDGNGEDVVRVHVRWLIETLNRFVQNRERDYDEKETVYKSREEL